MDTKRMWMVRAGEGGYLFDNFMENNIVAIGWEIGDLRKFENLDGIRTEFRKVYPHDKAQTVAMNCGQLFRFAKEFEIGEYVVTYNSSERIYKVGEIVSEYFYDAKATSNYHHVRKVKWIGTIPRDNLPNSAKSSLGSIATIFEINSQTVSVMLSVLSGKTIELSPENPEETDIENIKNEFAERAHEFIKDKVTNLPWDEMQELVAAIMRAMGYKTRISPKGSDRGKDIMASPDGLGLEEPRIIIEVKHREGQMGSQAIRSFLGGQRGTVKCVYVSTGGFTKDAKYEAERSNIPTTLIDADLLVDLIIQYYDDFDSDGKSLIPLRKVYWPA